MKRSGHPNKKESKRLMMKRAYLFVFLAAILCMAGHACAESAGFYCPNELEGMDLNSPASRWCWERSRESEHFICFWERGFGADPLQAPEPMRVDVDDLLEKAEQFWHTNAERVGMVNIDRSRLKDYKMQIYLLYTEEWVATGAGYDDVVGALWVSPLTCRPVGRVIAHEVAHCFQYQVYCDQLMNGETADFQSGFRYGHPDGNTFWEQCAQWVSFLDDPDGAYEEMGDWPQLCNLAFEHEWTRYQSYWLPMYWAEIHGEDVIGRIWNESRYPDDALSAYTRLFCQGDVEKLNDELYAYAVSMLKKAEPASAECYDAGDGWRQISYASCPGIAGYCVIPVPVGTTGVSFCGLDGGTALASDDPGIYRIMDEPIAGGQVSAYNSTTVMPGWRYGLVAMTSTGELFACAPQSKREGRANITLPRDTVREYLIVVGTPKEWTPSPWDEDERTDAQFPFRYKIIDKTEGT